MEPGAVLQTGTGLCPQRATWAPAPRDRLAEAAVAGVGGGGVSIWQDGAEAPSEPAAFSWSRGSQMGAHYTCSYNFSVGLKFFKLSFFVCFFVFKEGIKGVPGNKQD